MTALVPLFFDLSLNVDISNECEHTILRYTIPYRTKKLIELLIECNANIDVVNKNGKIVVHHFVKNKYNIFRYIPPETIMEQRPLIEKSTVDYSNWLMTKGFDFKYNYHKCPLNLFMVANLHEILPALASRRDDMTDTDKDERTLSQIVLQVSFIEYFKLKLRNKLYQGPYMSKVIKTLLNSGASFDFANELDAVLKFTFTTERFDLLKFLVDNIPEKHAMCLTKFLHYLIKNIKSYHLHFGKHDLQDVIETLICKTMQCQYEPISGYTTVQLAVLEKRIDILQFLYDYGIAFNVLTARGENLLHLLCQKPFNLRRIPISDKEYKETVDVLVSQGCDVNAVSETKQTPLHEATAHGRVVIIKSLIKHRADVNSRNKALMTPLHIAAAKDREFMVGQLLIKSGADVNLQDEMGRTALHFTLENKGTLAELLLNSGARADVQDKCKRTPLYLAILRRHLWEVERLVKYGANFNDCFLVKTLASQWYGDPAPDRILQDFILPKHWIKLSVAGLPCPKECQALARQLDFKGWQRECSKELDKLRRCLIYDRLTCLMFIQMNPNRRCAYVDNRTIKNFIKSPLYNRFPIYSSIIMSAYNEALARKPLLEPATRSLLELTEIALPDICVDRIFSYLNNASLINLIESKE
ncbi:putative ankyrin repeat protein RF_0381 [Phymastichus coffea]|uniref:putative ankyrin repeat protein RF_0381 n=1 Tax=Phymastichus coffea TaxID=108790 RepID=UPI00273A7F56|nr:putative ankyrin repeat protein RF_0381 [Phymastichus coffea]XP_058802969.1 putative ankyrin repeat protein RF_0381 [Phymastichus coffea]